MLLALSRYSHWSAWFGFGLKLPNQNKISHTQCVSKKKHVWSQSLLISHNRKMYQNEPYTSGAVAILLCALAQSTTWHASKIWSWLDNYAESLFYTSSNLKEGLCARLTFLLKKCMSIPEHPAMHTSFITSKKTHHESNFAKMGSLCIFQVSMSGTKPSNQSAVQSFTVQSSQHGAATRCHALPMPPGLEANWPTLQHAPPSAFGNRWTCPRVPGESRGNEHWARCSWNQLRDIEIYDWYE